MDLAKIFAFKYMAIFREPNLNFREISHVNSEKMPAKGHFLIFNLIVVVLSIVLSTLILLLRRFLLGRRFSKGSSVQGLWRPLQGWIKGRGTDAPWKKKKKEMRKTQNLCGCLDALKKTCTLPRTKDVPCKIVVGRLLLFWIGPKNGGDNR